MEVPTMRKYQKFFALAIVLTLVVFAAAACGVPEEEELEEMEEEDPLEEDPIEDEEEFEEEIDEIEEDEEENEE